MALDAISSNATPCVYASNQHFLQNVEMTWSYTSDVGMMHLVIPFFLQIAVGDASVQVASLWEEKKLRELSGRLWPVGRKVGAHGIASNDPTKPPDSATVALLTPSPIP